MEMQKCLVLVTGASGFIGRELCNYLSEGGYEVRKAVRSAAKDSQVKVDAATIEANIVIVGSIGATTDWGKALEGVGVVVHLAARAHVICETSANPENEFREVNIRGTLHLAEAATKAGVKRFIYISSIGVNGNKTIGTPFDEYQRPHPKDLYAISKWEAENELRRVAAISKMEIVILRPPLVYGPANPGNILRLLRIVERGFPLPFASIDNQRSFIYIGNLVNAIANCIESDAAANQTYLICDGEDVSTENLIRRLAGMMGKQPRLFSLPEAALRMLGTLVGKSDEISRLIDSLVVNSSKIRAELGWKPPYSLGEGLRVTLDWYRQHRNMDQKKTKSEC